MGVASWDLRGQNARRADPQAAHDRAAPRQQIMPPAQGRIRYIFNPFLE